MLSFFIELHSVINEIVKSFGKIGAKRKPPAQAVRK